MLTMMTMNLTSFLLTLITDTKIMVLLMIMVFLIIISILYFIIGWSVPRFKYYLSCFDCCNVGFLLACPVLLRQFGILRLLVLSILPVQLVCST